MITRRGLFGLVGAALARRQLPAMKAPRTLTVASAYGTSVYKGDPVRRLGGYNAVVYAIMIPVSAEAMEQLKRART